MAGAGIGNIGKSAARSASAVSPTTSTASPRLLANRAKPRSKLSNQRDSTVGEMEAIRTASSTEPHSIRSIRWNPFPLVFAAAQRPSWARTEIGCRKESYRFKLQQCPGLKLRPAFSDPRSNLCDDTFRERHQETTCIHLVTSRPPFDPAGVGLRLPPPASLSRFLIQNEELRLSSLFILCRVCRPEDRWQASCTVILRLGTRMPPQMKHDYHN